MKKNAELFRKHGIILINYIGLGFLGTLAILGDYCDDARSINCASSFDCRFVACGISVRLVRKFERKTPTYFPRLRHFPSQSRMNKFLMLMLELLSQHWLGIIFKLNVDLHKLKPQWHQSLLRTI